TAAGIIAHKLATVRYVYVCITVSNAGIVATANGPRFRAAFHVAIAATTSVALAAPAGPKRSPAQRSSGNVANGPSPVAHGCAGPSVIWEIAASPAKRSVASYAGRRSKRRCLAARTPVITTGATISIPRPSPTHHANHACNTGV